YNSSSSIKLNNYQGMNGDYDDLISPSFDLSAGGPLYLNFRYTCATNANVSSDVSDDLYVASSINCGQTWIQRLIIHSSDLANAGYFSGAYAPNASSPWVGKSILLSSSLYQPNVRFRFEYKTNGMGNNFYIDDVNVSTNPVGIQDPDAASFAMNIFPNPITESSVAILNKLLSGNVEVKIIDLQGRIVSVLYRGWLSEGQHQFDLNSAHLASQQMYFLVADDGLNIQREKFVVQ
ncbi:MAG: T9SS type A sorting domain-containing protein, partial [Chitinophagales bacterium]